MSTGNFSQIQFSRIFKNPRNLRRIDHRDKIRTVLQHQKQLWFLILCGNDKLFGFLCIFFFFSFLLFSLSYLYSDQHSSDSDFKPVGTLCESDVPQKIVKTEPGVHSELLLCSIATYRVI